MLEYLKLWERLRFLQSGVGNFPGCSLKSGPARSCSPSAPALQKRELRLKFLSPNPSGQGRAGQCSAARGEKGGLASELAILMPLFLLIVAGVIDYGLLFWEKVVITNAVREGARAASRAADQGFGAKAELSPYQVRQVVQNYLDSAGVKAPNGQHLILSDETFSYFWSDTGSGIYLTVVLQNIPYRMLLLPAAQSIFSGRNSEEDLIYLNARITMAAEWTEPPTP